MADELPAGWVDPFEEEDEGHPPARELSNEELDAHRGEGKGSSIEPGGLLDSLKDAASKLPGVLKDLGGKDKDKDPEKRPPDSGPAGGPPGGSPILINIPGPPGPPPPSAPTGLSSPAKLALGVGAGILGTLGLLWLIQTLRARRTPSGG